MASTVALGELERVETGFAVLYRSATEVFKVRKPVRLRLADERLDLDSIEARHAACLEEARVNQQLAPGVARGVVALTRSSNGTLRFGGAGAPVEWALRMQRLPDSDRAQERLAAGTLHDEQLQAVARRLAAFHERTRGAAGDGAVLETLRTRITLRIESPETPLRAPLPEEIERVERWQLELLEMEGERFLSRARSDSIRDGHGELALDHVFIDAASGVQILAGLEISPRFRNADVAADIALLATDLAARHRADLAERFVAEYARLANDFDLYPLLDFYASLRASTRAKLDWFCAECFAADPKRAGRYRERARRFLVLALAAPRRSLLPPSVVVIGGQVASGKSTLALEIARRIGAPVVGSDATRDYLLGARLNEDLHEARWEEAYEAGFAERVYAEVLRRAGEVLESNRPVVIDGCFRSRDQRMRARVLAERSGSPFLFVEARVSRQLQRARLAERALRDSVPIEDWQEIADQLGAQWEPATELPEAEHLPLDTALPPARNVAAVEDRLPTWPTTLTG